MRTRLFGAALIGGGVLTLIANGVFSPLLPVEGSFAELAGSLVFLARLSLAAAGLMLVLLGMVGLYLRHAATLSWFGAMAFVLAFLGTAAIMAHEWAQVFVIHHIARIAPGTLDVIENVEGPNLFDIEAMIVAASFSLGWIVWCIAMLRARLVPWIGSSLVLLGLFGTPLLGAAAATFGASAIWGMAVGGVLFALGWMALGAALLKTPRAL